MFEELQLNMRIISLLSLYFYIIVSFVSLTNGHTTEEDIEYVTVHKLSGDVVRSKRSVKADFPAEFNFRLQMVTGNVTMNLIRSVPSEQTIPIYTINGNNGLTKHKEGIQKTYGVYQDGSLGASIIVRCPTSDTQKLQLFGSFTHGGQHYQIEPDVSLNRERRSDESATSGEVNSETLRHRIRRQTNPYGDFLGDELLPPPDSSGLNRPPLMPPYPGEPVTRGPNQVPIIMLEEDKPVVLQASGQLTQDDQKDDPTDGFSRRRRDTSETLYIEYMVVIDYKNMERWKSIVGGENDEEIQNNAFDAMQEYYQFVVNGIDARFRTATENGPVIRVNLTDILVSTESSTSPWIQNNILSPNSVDDAGVLLDFATWRSSMIQYLPRHDHAGLFTGFDIATPTSLNPIGMGYLNSICHNSWAVSEIEETYNAVTVHIAAHELGHNIGTRHDGNGNGCASSSLYLMAPRLPSIYDASIRTNPWTFSTCSQNAIKTFIDGLGSGNCLTDTPETRNIGNDLAGQIYDVDRQCNMTFESDAVLCRENLYNKLDSVCYATQCKKKGANSCEGRFFPFDGTPCGDKKWCMSGLCVYSDIAPSADETCLFGDDPNVDCTSPNACDVNDVLSSQVLCCGTCSQTLTATTVTTTPSTTTPPTTTPTTTTTSTPTTTTTTPTTTTTTTPMTTPPTTTPTTTTPTTTTPTTTTTTPTTTTPTTTTTTTPTTTTPTTTTTTPTTTTPTTTTTTTPTTTTPTTTTPTTTTPTTTTPTTTTPTTTTTTTTTQPTTTISTSPTTTTTMSTTVTTTMPTTTMLSTTKSTTISTTDAEPDLELTFDLQTMISLFVTSALVV